MPGKTALKTLTALLLAALLPGGISSFGTPEGRSQEKTKVIIDTDIGEDIDDILVTAFALNSPELDVLAITTVDGNVDARSRIARKVAMLYGKPEMPIAAGYVRSMPLADITYTGFSGGVRYGEVAPDEQGLPPVSPLRADALIAELANQHPGEVTVVTIGSMSNIGHFLVRYPDAAKKLKQIVTNGGSFTTQRQQIGWNLRYDPVAAVVTARSEVPWVLLSESTAHFCGLRQKDVDRLKNAGLPTTTLLAEAIHWWKTNKTDATRLPHVSDLDVFAYLLGGWVETVRGNVSIEIGPQGSLPRFRVEEDPSGRIVLGGDIPKEKAAILREILMERLLAPPGWKDRLIGPTSTPPTAPRRGYAQMDVTLNFTRDGGRKDGSETPFAAGHKIDDIFFFLEPGGSREVDLLIDEVVLFDAHPMNRTAPVVARLTSEPKAPERNRTQWIGAMKRVHAKFTGQAGTFAQFGDSISASRAFWFTLRDNRRNVPPEMAEAFNVVSGHMLEDCWDRKGPQYGNQGQMTIRWAHENVDAWLKDLNPEVAIIMFGTNDLNRLDLDEYESKTRHVVKRCLDNGTVVVLSTIPPRHRRAEKAAAFAEAVRRISRELKVPLTDYHAEILKRRPHDWDGALEKFSQY